ncbi:galactoside alpha-(1,2)-fucosyltransferase 2-like [Ylistrum balloti]|uniref:galactoside alpha-(1,2)-fucosyltransferase 2-like n=1 Tax=Ylistrum balloti TaxID=509963 RepID=UPI002905B609|nr:galactoside alpha-(1,2)-fucosyltransferase 2-like [Ylistrum balloti]
MKLKRKWCLQMHRTARFFLVICILAVVVINISLIRALNSEDRWYISFFNSTKWRSTPSRSKPEPHLRKEPVYVETSKSPTCEFYKPNSKNRAVDLLEYHYMTVDLNGRLGNQMFKYASLLGIAAQHGYTPFLRQKSLLFSAFEFQKYFRHISTTNRVSFGERHAGIYDCRIHNLTHSKNITLNGYYQSWKYFHHVIAQVRKLFQFTDDIVRRAKKIINSFRPGNKTLVGVHVRRGDMSTKRELRRGYNVADVKYFRKVFEYFRYEFEEVLFIVVSDSVSWVKTNLEADDVVFSETSIAYLDMAILAHCKHSIITSGTFGWWGAYLAGGKTVYFKDYPKPKTWLSDQYNRNDYYPPNWIPM